MPMFQRSVIVARNRPPPRGSTSVAASNSCPTPTCTSLGQADANQADLALERAERVEVADDDVPPAVARQLRMLESTVVDGVGRRGEPLECDHLVAPGALG